MSKRLVRVLLSALLAGGALFAAAMPAAAAAANAHPNPSEWWVADPGPTDW